MNIPMITPKNTPSSAANGATFMTSRAPAITRDNTSRPCSSVPNGNPARGDRWVPVSEVERVVRCDLVAEDGTDGPDQHDEHADDEPRPAADQSPVLATGLLALADLHDAAQLDLRRCGRGAGRDGDHVARHHHVCARCRDDLATAPREFLRIAHRVVSSRIRGLRNAMSTSASSVETM